MAVRFDASGENYLRAITIGGVTDWSASCWVKLAVDRATFTGLWQIDDGSGGNFLRLAAWNGADLAYQTTGAAWYGTVGQTLAIGEWTYVAISATANPGLVRTRARTASSTAFAGGSPPQSNVTFTANTVRIGATNSGTEWLNGSICAVKMWAAALSEEELEQESWTYAPHRTTNLRVWYPLLKPENIDYSGNNETPSGGSGTSLDDGPPISWRTGHHRRPITTAGISGALTGTLPALTGSLTGDTTATGGLAGTLPALTSSITGTATASGPLAGTLPSLTGNLTGSVSISALSAALPALTGSLTGTVKASGTLAGTLPALTGALLGEVEIPPDDITLTTAGPARGWAADSIADDWVSSRPPRGWAAGSPTT